ncbi:MAG: hypothetical protein Q9225_008066, partial [Loekoesia sp. 1 TL-2023]
VTAWNASEIQPIAQLWSDALQAAPAVQQVLWPTNATDNSQTVQLSNVQSTETIGSLLENALRLILSDVDTFLAFAGNGRFVTEDIPGIIPSMLGKDFDIFTGVHTFVTSKLMQGHDIFATPGDIVDQSPFESNTDCVASISSGCTTRDGRVFYWSPSTHRQYELRYKSNRWNVNLPDLIQHIGNDNFADPQLLFDGNYNCTAEGKAGGYVVNPGPNGTVDVSC